MRRLLISLGLISSVLLGIPATSLAQNAVNQYPWCWELKAGGTRSCYYATWEQCHTEAFTRGGFCVQSPYYQPQAAVKQRAGVPPRHHRHLRLS